MKNILGFIIGLLIFSLIQSFVGADEIQFGVVKKVLSETKQGQKLEVLVGGKLIRIDTGSLTTSRKQFYTINDEVLLSHIKQQDRDIYFIREFVRTKPLIALVLIFFISVVVVSGRKGVLSIIGMVGSFFVLFYYLLPAIVSGADPVNTSLVTASILIPITFYISHGLNKETTIAVLSSLLALVIVVILSVTWIQWAKLTGFSGEESAFLDIASKGSFDMRGILLASIVIGALGILDDVTISQVSIVRELRKVGHNKNSDEIFFHAMKIGQDHISSMVNTLILVYIGAALPLFLLFIHNPQPFSQVVQYEMIAEEVIRSLIGSIGIIISVPLSTYIASRIE